MTFVKVVMALFARNATSGLTEPVNKTNDSRHAAHVEAGLGQIYDAGNSGAFSSTDFTTRNVTTTTAIGTTLLQSAALFLATDVGSRVTGTGIPAGAVVVRFVDTSNVYFQTPGSVANPQGEAATASGSVSLAYRKGFAGTFTQTLDLGYIRQQLVLGTNAVVALGGSLTFHGSDDGINNTVVVVKSITDLRTVKHQNLKNVWGYFKVTFSPDRTLTGGELVFLRTQHTRQDDGAFAVQLTDRQEKSNLLLPQTAAYLKGFDSLGNDVDVLVDDFGALVTGSGSEFERLLQRKPRVGEQMKLDVEPANTDFYIAFCPTGAADSATTHNILRIYLSATKNPTQIRFRTGLAWSARSVGW